jgi:hypothetical protein
MPCRGRFVAAEGIVTLEADVDRQQAQDFRERWRTVNQFIEAEKRNATVDERWRQFIALLDPRFVAHIRPSSRSDDDIRDRWMRLKSEHIR